MSPAAPRTSATDNTNFTKIALKDQASIETGECAEGAKFSIGWRSAVARLSRWAGVLVGFLIFATCLIAQTQFGSFAVGVSSGAVSVNVMAIAAGSVSNIEVLTMGTSGLDYVLGTGTTSCNGVLSPNSTCTVSVAFTPKYPGIRLGAVVLLDSSNNVLGTTYLEGTGQGALAVLTPGNYIPVAGNGAWDLPGDGQLATNAELNQPSSVVLDGAGNMYIADSVHNLIRKVTASTGIIATIAGNGTAGYSGDGSLASASVLNTPSGVALDGAGNLFIADTGNNRVRKISAATSLISTVAGNGSIGDSNGENVGDTGLATAANLNQPWGVTVDAAGNLYIADTANHRIRLVTMSTGTITTVAGIGHINSDGSGAPTYPATIGDGGLATSAYLNRPFAVAFDASGNMYIPDSLNNRVRVVNKNTGNITTLAGTGIAGYGGDGGPANSAELWAPSGVIVDVAQNVYISDTQNNAIRKVNASGSTISTIIRNGAGYDEFSGNLYVTSLYGPIGLALDGMGNVYVADYLYMRIREIQSNVSLLNFTGTPVRQGQTSSAQQQMLENDGNQPLDLTGFTPDSNAQLDPSTTTCGTGSPYLTQDTACYIGAIFAPSLTSIGDPLFANIDVAAVSVNAVNAPLDIVLAGDATAINSTTTVLTSSLNPSNYGQSVTFTAAVTTGPNTGILDGTVTFVDTSTGITLQSAVPVNSVGRAFYTTTNLAVGTHNITASYSGDTLHSASSTTTALAQVVNEGTTTTLVSSANPALLGANVTFTATVTAPGGGGVVPIGTVVFTDGSTVLATVTLNGSAVATYSTSTLAVGPHAISAAYSGSTPYYVSASTSATLNQDVQATSVTTLVSSLNPSTYGASITLTSVVTSNGTIVPTGTVDINDGTTRIGTVSLAGTTGVATWTVSSLIVGSHTLTAYYEGNPYNAPSTSAPVVQVVSPAQTTTVVTATPDPGIAGRAVRLTATITETNGSGQITGTVTFTEGTTNLGTVAVSGGAASISPVLAPGAHTIVATYSGDRNNSASVSAAFPITVILATTSTTIASSASPAIVLSSITFTASVAGNGGMPTGVVTFSADGATIGTGTLNASGVATFSTSTLGVGSHTITASYGGDVDDSSSSSAALTQIVGSIPTTTGLGASATAGPNPQTIFVATVVGASGPTPTGTVTFTDGSKFIGSSTLDSTGVATLSPDLATGSYNVVASYGGDAIHGPSTSQTELISSTAAGFNIVVAPPNLTLAVSQNGTLGITVSSNNNFADTIGLGCSSVPFAVNCHFSSNTINLAAGGSQTIQLTIDTNNPLSGGTTAMNASKGSSSLAGLFFPASLVFGIVCWRFRRKNAVVLTALLVLLFSGATLATGCSGGFSQSTAAPGTYSIQVTGVGANSNITHYGTVTLTITK